MRAATPDPGFWHGRRVLVTGHTGFKGSWLCLWLQALGARVHGLALPPATDPALYTVARVDEGMASSTLGDIRDAALVARTVAAVQPEVLLHLAAQPLVRQSYADPVQTYATNVMGTVHLLEAVRRLDRPCAVVNVTTDKCYENREWLWGYREDEALGGHDPYSSSKACAELVTSAYRRSFLAAGGTALATARAGNVIGGGDWSPDRLVPDVLRSFERGEPVALRHPRAVRPWQHVLEPLSGYLVLAERLATQGQAFAEAWNFGPGEDDAQPVQALVEQLAALWGGSARWQIDGAAHPHEAHALKLDSAKARTRLGWRPHWRLAQSLQAIVAWHQAWQGGADMRRVTLQQIHEHHRLAAAIPS